MQFDIVFFFYFLSVGKFSCTKFVYEVGGCLRSEMVHFVL